MKWMERHGVGWFEVGEIILALYLLLISFPALLGLDYSLTQLEDRGILASMKRLGMVE